MLLRKLLAVNNDCYKANKRITPKGLMLHSTGADNPNLKRYVQPDDGLLGKHPYDNHFNVPRPGGRQVCPHGVIGKLASGRIATYQILPWNMRGWHAGGKGNDSLIGVEICEDGLTNKDYFNQVYQEAVELFTYLCREYNLTERNIMDHAEGYKKGLASNHGDVGHWFKKHGKSMDTFRADVKKELTITDKGDVLMRNGSKGNDVKALQQNLVKLGYSLAPYGADGMFGAKTVEAVKKFQKANKLTADGIAGAKTLAKVAELLKPKPAPKKDAVDYKSKYDKMKALAKQILEV